MIHPILRSRHLSRVLTTQPCLWMLFECECIHFGESKLIHLPSNRWFLGLLHSLVIPAFNTAIPLRCTLLPYPPRLTMLKFPIDPFIITILFIQLITLPVGKFLEWALPGYCLSMFGYLFSPNPGQFNIKEHTLIAIMITIMINEWHGWWPITTCGNRWQPMTMCSDGWQPMKMCSDG